MVRGGLQNVLVLLQKLCGPCVFLVVFIAVLILKIVFLLHDLDVGRIHFHVGRPVVEYRRRNNGHRVSQLPELGDVVREAAVDAELAMTAHLEVLAELRLVVAVKDADELLAWEGFRERLQSELGGERLTSFMFRFSSEPCAKLHILPSWQVPVCS